MAEPNEPTREQERMHSNELPADEADSHATLPDASGDMLTDTETFSEADLQASLKVRV